MAFYQLFLLPSISYEAALSQDWNWAIMEVYKTDVHTEHSEYGLLFFLFKKPSGTRVNTVVEHLCFHHTVLESQQRWDRVFCFGTDLSSVQRFAQIRAVTLVSHTFLWQFRPANGKKACTGFVSRFEVSVSLLTEPEPVPSVVPLVHHLLPFLRQLNQLLLDLAQAVITVAVTYQHY